MMYAATWADAVLAEGNGGAAPQPPASASVAPLPQAAQYVLELGDWVRLESERLRLDRERFDQEKKWHTAASPTPSGAAERLLGSSVVAALLTALLGLVLYAFQNRAARAAADRARRHEFAKLWGEVMIARSAALTSERLTRYRELWQQLTWLSLYPLRAGLTAADLREVHDRLRDWYFSGGGMILSRDRGTLIGAQSRYLAVQDALAKTLEGLNPGTAIISPADRLNEQQAKADERQHENFRAGGVMPDFGAHFERFRFLRALGSRLRTAMVADLDSRAGNMDTIPELDLESPNGPPPR